MFTTLTAVNKNDATYTASMPFVQLRNVTVSDLPALFTHESDPEASRMAAVVPREMDAFNKHWRKILDDPEVFVRAILVDGGLAGYINCFKVNGQDMVGYWIAQEYWGRGVATRSLELLLGLMTRRPLHARAATHNHASIRVLEKCGFTILGHERSPATGRLLECDETILILR